MAAIRVPVTRQESLLSALSLDILDSTPDVQSGHFNTAASVSSEAGDTHPPSQSDSKPTCVPMPPVSPLHPYKYPCHDWTTVTRTTKPNYRKHYCAMLAFAGVLVCLTSFCIVSTFAGFPRSYRRTVKALSDLHCVPCERLILSSDPQDDFTGLFDKKQQNGQEQCCATNSTQFAKLIDVMIERRLREGRARGSPLVGVPPQENQSGSDFLAPQTNLFAAHLFLKNVPDTSDSGFQVLRGWSKENDVAFVHEGVEFDANRGRITILQKGLYVVYSRLTFEGLKLGPEEKAPVIAHRIMRENIHLPSTGAQELLVDSRLPECNEPVDGLPCHTTVLMSIFKLRTGDELFVEAKPSPLIMPGKGSYFGIYHINW